MGVTVEVGKKVTAYYKGDPYEDIECVQIEGNPLGILHLFHDGVEENALWFGIPFYPEFLRENNLTGVLVKPNNITGKDFIPLTNEIAMAVNRSLKAYQKAHPDLAPAYCNCSFAIQKRGCECGAAPGSGTLASLMRLDYWMILALETIPNPYICIRM